MDAGADADVEEKEEGAVEVEEVGEEESQGQKDCMTTIINVTRTDMIYIVTTRVALATRPYWDTVTMRPLQIIKEDRKTIVC